MFCELLGRVQRRVSWEYRKHVKRDPFVLAHTRWFSDAGDHSLRLDMI